MGKHDIGGTSFKMSQGTSRQVIAVTCSKCGEVTPGSDKPSAPLDVVIRHFATRGFLITERGRKAVCPKCQVATREVRSVDESEVMAALDRQREAEAARIKATQKPKAEPIAPAPAPVQTIITPAEAAMAEMRRFIAEVPMNPKRPSMRNWRAAPQATAEIVRIYLAANQYDRAQIFDRMGAECTPLRTSLLYFAAGLVSDGSKPWDELRTALDARGVKWTDRQRGNRTRRSLRAHESTDMQENQNVTPSHPAATPTIEQTREARRATAKMYALLDQHFTVADGSDMGTYADGWSDERVAQETGLSALEVSRSREDVYGRLAEDPRLAELSAKIDALVDRAGRDLGDLAKMAAAIREQVDTAVADLRRQMDAIRRPKVVAG